MEKFSSESLTSAEATTLWDECGRGEPQALDRVLPMVYEDLRRMARFYLSAERDGHTLEPTALVHEAYLRLLGQEKPDWSNRAQFLGIAARMMRRILVNYGEARRAMKRTAQDEGHGTTAASPFSEKQLLNAMAVHRALHQLSHDDPRQEKIIELRFYAGFSIEETAEALGLSAATVKREWAVARLWISKQLADAAR